MVPGAWHTWPSARIIHFNCRDGVLRSLYHLLCSQLYVRHWDVCRDASCSARSSGLFSVVTNSHGTWHCDAQKHCQRLLTSPMLMMFRIVADQLWRVKQWWAKTFSMILKLSQAVIGMYHASKQSRQTHCSIDIKWAEPFGAACEAYASSRPVVCD